MTDVTTDEQAPAMESGALDDELVRKLADRARVQGLQLSGDGGLLQNLTKVFMDAALEGEMDEHLGYGKHEAAGRDRGNSRNGKRSKQVLTDAGPVDVDVPCDR